MEPRLNYLHVAPGVGAAMHCLDKYLSECGLDAPLLNLVKIRASQLNGCAYCIDMHTKDARADGETEQRLYALDAWREAPFYTERERAALAWTEAVTHISHGHVPDEVYKEVNHSFGDKELVDLTLAVVSINGWNRLAISFRSKAGMYQPKKVELAARAKTA
ncbi:MAG TPA: carboxymuconolactone decarboxylase family protein [Spirochaetia bacterium]|nr:carboxymuconolactone decarboxylase family protein [Spirochaetia bacterium]